MTMKKGAVCSAALLALVGTSALAAPNLTNVNQKGSLLVFPLIDTQNDRDTIIFMTNDNTTYVDVKCYYGEYTNRYPEDTDDLGNPRWDPEQLKPTADFMFRLTKNHPVIWTASNGLSPVDGNGIRVAVPPFPTSRGQNWGVGQLVCWAVSEGGQRQVKFNHLSGMAKIVDPEAGQSWEYSAYSFYCRGGRTGRARELEQCGPDEGTLYLDGKDYDKCGQYIIGQFIPEGAPTGLGGPNNTNYNLLSVSSCKQDLSPVGYARPNFKYLIFDVWSGQEVKFTGAKDYVDGWWRIYLGPRPADGGTGNNVERHNRIDNRGQNFLYRVLNTGAAYYRAQSEDEEEGLVGVQVQYHDDVGYSATTVHHAGDIDEGFIKFKTQPDNPPERK